MNLVVVILVLIALWVAWSFAQSYRNIERQLQEIKVKCVGSNLQETAAPPGDIMKSQLLGGLRMLKM